MTSSTPRSSRTMSSRATPSPSQFSSSPSTKRSSVFSSTDSVLSTSPASLLSEKIFKRKHGQDILEAKANTKRRKAMGRPKNAWTPTRLRKLVRLYLLTNLKVIQIAKVLQSKDFHPGLRDTQEQLKSLLQARPNTIRLGAHITKARLGVLRDCRELRKFQRIARVKQSIPQNEEDNADIHIPEDTIVSTLAIDDFGDDWSWLDLGLVTNHEDLATSSSHFGNQSITKSQEDFPKPLAVDAASTNLLIGMEGLSAVEEMQTLKPTKFKNLHLAAREQHIWKQDTEVEHANEGSPTSVRPAVIDKRILADFGMQSTQARAPSSHLQSVSVTRPCGTPEFVIEDYDLPHNFQSPVSPVATSHSIFSGQKMADSILPGLSPDTEARLPIGGRPSRESITSLDQRLPECSQSCMEDIVSILERHTIGGSSAASSSTRTSHVSSKKSSRVLTKQADIERSFCSMDEPPLLPVKVKPPNVLPGIFHVYCAAQITLNKLRHCRHDGMPCEHKSPDIRPFFISHIMSKVVIYNRIRSQHINETDQYGNSLLHVAASFCAPIPYIIKLIKQNANINAINSAGETFLHLIYGPCEEDDVCSLLELLSTERFNFGQHDQHGQTSIHLLTRPWLPQHYLIKVIRKIQSLGFVLPTSRDNLGFTILMQMKNLGTQALGFDPGQELATRLLLGLTSETQGYIIRPYKYTSSVNSVIGGNESLHHYEKQNLVYSLDDLRRYEYHADLLRTIIKARDRPWYEDGRGRNGLHCLAEVAFNLPLSDEFTMRSQSTQKKTAGIRYDLRESYLDGLLEVGVNPNNYDKSGNTPLMSFILNSRLGETDDTTISIFKKLIASNADIDRRNRRGETALHLAVKSGCLAITKFLIRKGANIHARNKKGSGVQKLGTEACKKATQDGELYAQIMLCMDSVMRAGAVASPTIIQEWSLEGALHQPSF